MSAVNAESGFRNDSAKFGNRTPEAWSVAFSLTIMSLPGALIGQPLVFNIAPQKQVLVDDARQDLRQARREIELLKTMVRSRQAI